MEDKVLYKWRALDRPNKKWSRDYYSTVMVFAFLISVIFYFIEGFVLAMLVWSVVFMMWSLNRLPTQEVDYEITARGIKSGKAFYPWGDMGNYYMEEKWGTAMLRIGIFKFPWQLIFVIPVDEKDKINKIMSGYLEYEVPKETWTDRVIKWLEKKLPID